MSYIYTTRNVCFFCRYFILYCQPFCINQISSDHWKLHRGNNLNYISCTGNGIGLFQCLALWPGFSRSGATISGGMLMGISRQAAAEFSFILAVPMMVAASGLDLYKSRDFLSMADFPMFAVGFITAFVVAMFAIKTFLALIRRLDFIPFAIYRFIVAFAVYLVFVA